MTLFRKCILAAVVALLFSGLALANSLRPIQAVPGEQPKPPAQSEQNGSVEDQAQQDPVPAVADAQPDAENTAGEDDAGTSEPVFLDELGSERADVPDNPLSLPAEGDDIAFLKGRWSFKRDFLTSDGHRLRADLAFDDIGLGQIQLRDEQNREYTARARAKFSDNTLKIQTSTFTDAQSKPVYRQQFMECRSVNGHTYCQGSDGFTAWNGQELLFNSAVADRRSQSSSSSADQSRVTISERSSQSSASENYSELSADGPELPPVVMENAETARVRPGASPIAALAGDWRYSKDLARKSDGKSVSLEFHFDENGQGYSSIKDSSGRDARAAAQAFMMQGGTIRVKTDVYNNGQGHGYYPSFMTCRVADDGGLRCDVSNGWTRITDGRLVSKSYLEQQGQENGQGNVRPAGSSSSLPSSSPSGSVPASSTSPSSNSAGYPATGLGNGAGSASADPGSGSSSGSTANGSGGSASSAGQSTQQTANDDMATALTSLATQAAQQSSRSSQYSSQSSSGSSRSSSSSSRSSQASSQSSSRSSQTSSQASSMAIRSSSAEKNLVLPQKGEDISFLNGRWRCNTGLMRALDDQPIVFEFNFDKKGQGSATIREQSGTLFTASAKASHKDGTLRINTTPFYSKGSKNAYYKTYIQCVNDNNGALCSGENGDVSWNNVRFTRLN